MPLDPKLTKFSTTSQVLVNVDFGDFTKGLGYVEFFCFDSKDDTSTKFNILNKVIRGANKNTSGQTLEFTTKFGVTQIMDGEAYAQFHWGFRTNGNEGTAHATISIEKNGVELVSERGVDLVSSGNISRVEVINLDIPNTTFSPGDILKIKIVNTALGGVFIAAFIAHDPLDESFTPGGSWTGGVVSESVCKLNIPFQFI